ncbi:hypothetical protein [Frankia sp. CcI49]|uniref:hypothetical protein n=1 Tax=Frankia sp. CcI49 TaxID=1745382 RepID=UPI0010549EDE|nr:hypothetical protein [Frankia sp. CcI49]
MADVIPNPQNTAEVVVALAHAGRPSAGFEGLADALARLEVIWPDGRVWIFDTPIDHAWRLRGLCRLAPSLNRDRLIRETLDALWAQFTGRGWRLAPEQGESAFVTSVALLAIGEASDLDLVPELADRCIESWNWLLDNLARPRNQECPIAHTSWALLALSGLPFARWRNSAYRRAVQAGLRRLLEALEEPIPIEEEAFVRGPIRDKWRHPNLAVVIQAILKTDPPRLFTPALRGQFIQLMSHQLTDPLGAEGAFTLNGAGPITTYSTTHGVQTMVMVRDAFVRTSPGDLLELFCQLDGSHHSDSQKIAPGPGGSPILMNSTAGLAVGILFTALVAMFAPFVLGGVAVTDVSRKILACLLVYFLAVGWYGYPAARLSQTSNRHIALGIYGAVTAVVLPLVTYLVT